MHYVKKHTSSGKFDELVNNNELAKETRSRLFQIKAAACRQASLNSRLSLKKKLDNIGENSFDNEYGIGAGKALLEIGYIPLCKTKQYQDLVSYQITLFKGTIFKAIELANKLSSTDENLQLIRSDLDCLNNIEFNFEELVQTKKGFESLLSFKEHLSSIRNTLSDNLTNEVKKEFDGVFSRIQTFTLLNTLMQLSDSQFKFDIGIMDSLNELEEKSNKDFNMKIFASIVLFLGVTCIGGPLIALGVVLILWAAMFFLTK